MTINIGKDFALENSLFGAVKLTKTDGLGKYKYSGSGIGFDARENVLLPNGSGFGKNVIIFGGNMSSSVYIDNKKKITWFLEKVQQMV